MSNTVTRYGCSRLQTLSMDLLWPVRLVFMGMLRSKLLRLSLNWLLKSTLAPGAMGKRWSLAEIESAIFVSSLTRGFASAPCAVL